MIDARPYVEIPYAWDGCHCWELVRRVYADHGIELPAYRERLDEPERRKIAALIADVESGSDWIRMEGGGARPLDVVVFGVLVNGVHVPGGCGVLLRPSRVLYTSAALGRSVTAAYPTRLLGPEIGRYRHRSLS